MAKWISGACRKIECWIHYAQCKLEERQPHILRFVPASGCQWPIRSSVESIASSTHLARHAAGVRSLSLESYESFVMPKFSHQHSPTWSDSQTNKSHLKLSNWYGWYVDLSIPGSGIWHCGCSSDMPCSYAGSSQLPAPSEWSEVRLWGRAKSVGYKWQAPPRCATSSSFSSILDRCWIHPNITDIYSNWWYTIIAWYCLIFWLEATVATVRQVTCTSSAGWWLPDGTGDEGPRLG